MSNISPRAVGPRARPPRSLGGRLLRHHLPLALASVALYLGFHAYASRLASDPVVLRSLASAYLGMVLLAGTLALGPLDVLRGRRAPVSTDLRRDVGIWAGLTGLLHLVLGLQVHFRGRMWFYFVREVEATKALVPRTDLFGFANYTGAVAGLLLVMLLALSNDLSLRRLKARRWKALQRWSYGVLALVVAHGAAFQWTEDRKAPLVAAFALLSAGAVALQLAGYRARRRAATARPAEAAGRSTPR